MWEGRAQGVRRDVSALATAGLDVARLHAAAIELVGAVVPAELVCWASMDPDTGVISSMTSGANRIPQQYEPMLASYEYAPGEPHSFRELAGRGDTVAQLDDTRSSRLNEVWRPLGLAHEVRAIFRADGTCWGAAGMVRTTPFSPRETEFLAAVAPALGAATRLAARCSSHAGPFRTPGEYESSPRTLDTPAIVVVSGGGEVLSATASAESWRAELDEIAPGRFAVMLRAAAAGARTGTFKARIRDAHGGWILLEAGELISDGEFQAAVTISRASGADLTGLLLAAYGVTTRERDICHEVLAGQSTSDIAARLSISPYTVQDHLKSVFGKFGVRSRAELVARLS